MDAEPTAPEGSKRVFSTSALYSGNLLSYGAPGQSALQVADGLCQQAADGAELGGEWVAWRSTSRQPPIAP